MQTQKSPTRNMVVYFCSIFKFDTHKEHQIYVNFGCYFEPVNPYISGIPNMAWTIFFSKDFKFDTHETH